LYNGAPAQKLELHIFAYNYAFAQNILRLLLANWGLCFLSIVTDKKYRNELNPNILLEAINIDHAESLFELIQNKSRILTTIASLAISNHALIN